MGIFIDTSKPVGLTTVDERSTRTNPRPIDPNEPERTNKRRTTATTRTNDPEQTIEKNNPILYTRATPPPPPEQVFENRLSEARPILYTFLKATNRLLYFLIRLKIPILKTIKLFLVVCLFSFFSPFHLFHLFTCLHFSSRFSSLSSSSADAQGSELSLSFSSFTYLLSSFSSVTTGYHRLCLTSSRSWLFAAFRLPG